VKQPPIAAQPVSAYDAKTHLSRLLERAERGERFVITRHGRPVAQLVPFVEGDAETVRQLVERGAAIRANLARRGVTLAGILEPGETPRDLAHAGHRY
jgi:prevent-host-death family protein